MLENSFDALVIPSADEHQNEYVAPSDMRRGFITGFSGSAGTAVVTKDDQILWTDTRYTLQADQEVDCSWKIFSHPGSSPANWLAEQLQNGSKVGADVRLFGADEWEETEKKFTDSNILFEDSKTLFDEVWDAYGGRPRRNNGSLFIHDIEFAGIPWQNKVFNIRRNMKAQKADLFVVSALDDVAWLLNLRGSDIPYNSVFRSYVVLEAKEENPIHLFLVNSTQIPEEIQRHLNLNNCSETGMCIRVHPYNTIKTFLQDITQKEEIQNVLLSKKHPYSKGVSYYIYSSVPKEKRTLQSSPIMLLKAKKQEPEAKSMKEAQIKDAVALIEFFAFLEKEIEEGAHWDEISVLTPLRKFRSEQKHFRGDSFEAISSFGSNGAIVHYTPSNETKKVINNQSLYLLDSGGQYFDGTTDVTRTMHYGTPTPFQRETYTRVLQGAIDLATLIFPLGTKDIFADIIARRPLYDAGLDYGHGTGHGVGLYLNVHEGPTLVAMSTERSSTIEAGQFFSDEPGYYKKNEFGIRLESLLHVVDHPTLKDEWGRPMLQFEVVTLVPYEPKLIDQSLLTEKQCLFLNDYNKQTRDVIGDRLRKKGNEEALQWMTLKTIPLDCGIKLK